MSYGTTHEILKPIVEVMLPDPRFEHYAVGSGDNWRRFDISDLHQRICLSSLNLNVPDEVRRQFDIARNLMLYSWYVFEFHIVGEHHAYGALERALRIVLSHAKKTIRKKGKPVEIFETLGPLLRKAKENNLIVPDKLPAWQRVLERRKRHEQNETEVLQPLSPNAANEWFDNIIRIIPDFRNDLAHGGFKLYFEASLNTYELCADLIDALFPTGGQFCQTPSPPPTSK